MRNSFKKESIIREAKRGALAPCAPWIRLCSIMCSICIILVVIITRQIFHYHYVDYQCSNSMILQAKKRIIPDSEAQDRQHGVVDIFDFDGKDGRYPPIALVGLGSEAYRQQYITYTKSIVICTEIISNYNKEIR